MDVAALDSLHEKYVRIRELRLASDAAESPREALRALALRFPGALRELDALPMSTIEARITSLTSAIEGRTPPPPWAAPLARYHGLMRAALRLKRSATRCRDAEIVRSRWLGSEAGGPDEPPRETWTLERVSIVLRPPGGRLNPWVLGEVAREEGLEPEALLALIFPTCPRVSEP